jgi:hypothetical protein
VIALVRGHPLTFALCTPGDEKVVLHLDVPSVRSASLKSEAETSTVMRGEEPDTAMSKGEQPSS